MLREGARRVALIDPVVLRTGATLPVAASPADPDHQKIP